MIGGREGGPKIVSRTDPEYLCNDQIFRILVLEDRRKYPVGCKLTCKYEGIIDQAFWGRHSKR